MTRDSSLMARMQPINSIDRCLHTCVYARVLASLHEFLVSVGLGRGVTRKFADIARALGSKLPLCRQ